VERLTELGRQEKATLFMTLLAAFKTLLYRYSGQPDIVVGTPVANRNRSEVEGVIGFFLNTLALRTHLQGDESYRELLRDVREVCLSGYTHQDVPFEKLVEELKPARSLSHSPIFQVNFQLHHASTAKKSLAGLTVEPMNLRSDTAKFDLSLLLVQLQEELRGTLCYNADLFDAETIDRMALHFQRLLESIVANPDERISQLRLLGEREVVQLLHEWNDTSAEYQAQCMHEQFAEQAKRTPEALAVVLNDEEVSYVELNERANQLAHYLRAKGVGPESLVGICVERSVEMVVGLFGILKAGGAFVPLDASYPRERLHYMLADAHVKVLLTEERLADEFAESGVELVCLDAAAAELARQSVADPVVQVSDANLAYVIYTSGSTGRPKGVAIQHRSVAALGSWAREVFSKDELAGVLASTSICFDLSIFELFVPLTCGGKVVLAENLLQLPDLPRRSEVTLVNTVPSAMAELVRMKGLPEFETVILCGEVFSHKLACDIFEHTTAKRVFNLYGPSEDTVYSTVALVDRDSDGPPTIGWPIHNSAVYVLDEQRRPVPTGVYGEICIAGDGLARGYLNRPEVTAEKFIPNAFSRKGGQRLYRTGDVGRRLPNGELEFAGRTDHQVKVRGYRIELGEIEAVLSRYEGINDVVVIVREDEQGDKYLVAYIVSAHEPPSSSELRAHLKASLPHHMIPSAFVVLNELPRTPNGKVDRRSLPAPDGVEQKSEAVYVSPRTIVEEALAGMWSHILRVERVGVADNFFELGGHSILAIRLLAQIEEAFQIKLPLRSLFEEPTIEAMERLMRADASQRERIEQTAELLVQLASMSDSELETTLTQKLAAGSAPLAVN
jgi:amino acid adenylation domain-containing protein